MYQKNSLAGSVLVVILLKNPELMLFPGHLHNAMMMDGSGLRILDWIVLVYEESFHLTRRVSLFFNPSLASPLVEADEETYEKNYLSWRIKGGVTEGSTEIPKGEAIPLEYNLAGLNATNFDKGCYVGQELVARTHHRGVIGKRLLHSVLLDNDGKEVEQGVVPGSEVIDAVSGKKVWVCDNCTWLSRARCSAIGGSLQRAEFPDYSRERGCEDGGYQTKMVAN